MAAEQPTLSDPVDPLHNLTGLSLFPRTIRAASTSTFKVSQIPTDFDSVHQFMKSMDLKRREKLMEDAKAIVNRGAELLKSSKYADFVASCGFAVDEDPIANAAGKPAEKPLERRPGLGLERKRPRFSIKPNTIQPVVNFETNLVKERLEDPEEFFAYRRKLENAKREIERQMGRDVDDFEQYMPNTNARQRRPGISRKSVGYKAHFSSQLSENAETLKFSQEVLSQDAADAHFIEPEGETIDHEVEPQDIGQEESRGEREIINKAASDDSEDIEADEALSLLQERLQGKTNDHIKFAVPDFHDIGMSVSLALKENLPRPRKSSFGINNLMKRVNRETPLRPVQVVKSPINSSASPPSSKSLFASISLMKKRISQSSPLRNSFSPLNNDISSPSIVENIDKQSGGCGSCAEHGSPRNIVNDTGLENVIAEGLCKNSNRKDLTLDVSPSESQVGLDEYDGNHGDERPICGNSSDQHVGTDATNRTQESVDLPKDGVPSLKTKAQADESTKSSGDADIQMGRSSEISTIVNDIPMRDVFSTESDLHIEGPVVVGNLNHTQNLSDQSRPTTAEDGTVKEGSTTTEVTPGQHTKIQERSPIRKPKRRPGGRGIRKAHPLRKSLAEAGTSFENGVRRSKRIKTRPLQFWEGERLLYGRLDKSLKLIGLKYISPAKDNTKLKLKSYVSDEYNELLELAARH